MLKKITLACALAFCMSMNAQFYEGFESGIPGSMTQNHLVGNVNWDNCGGTIGEGTCPISGNTSAAFHYESYAAVSTSLNTPVLDLSTGTYRLTYNFSNGQWTGYPDVNDLFVEISTDGGTNWIEIEHYNYDIPDFIPANFDLTPYSPSSTTVIRFRAINQYGFSTILDDVAVSEIFAVDAKLLSVNLDDIIVNGNMAISGDLTNFGSSTINSLDINWQVDGGTTYTETLTGLNIAPNADYSFSHDDQWNATPGVHTVHVWVSNVNGAGDDGNTENDGINKTVTVATQAVARLPLYEEFTSSTCGPCATFNTNYFNQNFFNANEGDYVLVKYQMNWPGAGDPYYTAEGGVRRNYYGINAAPTLLLDTKESTFFSTSALQTALNDALAVPSFMEITGDYTVTGNSIEVNTTVTPYLNGQFKLYVVVMEEMTVQNTGGNGESQFEHVMMKMLPNANGTVLNFTAGTPESNTFTADLSGTNVEEFDDLIVAVFVQKNSTKEIMQANYATNTLGVNENSVAELALYPNPSNGTLRISTQENVNIRITDILGKVQFSQNDVTSESILNVSNLTSGVYFATISQNGNSKTVKVIIN
ncbi:MAG TPA: T9SS type A sorting domain-containing protein [Flavobacteriaceae bacterium]|nr:T9SS type A sorting domain-containing protein [Flavobacteriaceae bacterium]